MNRRVLLRAMLGAGAAMGWRRQAGAQPDDMRLLPPQENDRFVAAADPGSGRPLTPDDIVKDARPVLAYPVDPATGTAREGSRLNQVALVRLDPETLAPDTRSRAAEGIVAYSAVCTHTGCEVTEWDEASFAMLCPCHDSRFDPKDGARVESGPAPRRLAALPLKIADGRIVVAGAFIGRVGPSQ